MKMWLIRIVRIIVIVEIVCLVLINAGLNLPLTQT